MSTFTYPDMNSITLGDTTNGSSVYTISGSSPLPVTIGTGIYTTNNTSPYNYNYTGIDTISISDYTNNQSLYVNGDANFEGDVKIKGKSLVDSLEKIEEKLAILRPNEELEAKWDQLRDLRKQYMELEKEIIAKEKVWDILKK